MGFSSSIGPALSDAAARASVYVEDNSTAVAVAGGLTALGAITYLATRKPRSDYQVAPSSFQLGVGNLKEGEVQSEVSAYYSEYNTLERGKGAQVANSKKVADFVDKFYSLVTDIYEWGWGQSFHFSPLLPRHTWAAAEAAHETRIGALIGLAPGKHGLDVGCGVGGPMRTIATSSGANITGITINEYQVKRATYHNKNLGVSKQCQAVRGNFLDMPFEANTFDGAYAIEATCHAPKLEEVYSEVHRVLKPGARFATYEWVSTPLYDSTDVEHVKLMDEIVIGNGLPDMRTWAQAEAAGKAVGFRLVESRDLAMAPATQVSPWWSESGAVLQPHVPEGVSVNPWYARLGRSRRLFAVFAHFNASLVWVAETLRLAPRGMGEIHKMLMDTAFALIDGGELGIFTPMHLLVFEKPAEKEAEE
ncbi:SMT1 [Auxenochlorella protothecoides x Auxenochlorella symbiontica]